MVQLLRMGESTLKPHLLRGAARLVVSRWYPTHPYSSSYRVSLGVPWLPMVIPIGQGFPGYLQQQATGRIGIDGILLPNDVSFTLTYFLDNAWWFRVADVVVTLTSIEIEHG